MVKTVVAIIMTVEIAVAAVVTAIEVATVVVTVAALYFMAWAVNVVTMSWDYARTFRHYMWSNRNMAVIAVTANIGAISVRLCIIVVNTRIVSANMECPNTAHHCHRTIEIGDVNIAVPLSATEDIAEFSLATAILV